MHEMDGSNTACETGADTSWLEATANIAVMVGRDDYTPS